MSAPNDCLRSLSKPQLPESDPKSVYVTFLGSLKFAVIFGQISGSLEPALNLDDSNDNIQVTLRHPLRSPPRVLQPKSYGTSRHRTRPLRHLQLNRPLIIIAGQVQAIWPSLGSSNAVPPRVTLLSQFLRLSEFTRCDLAATRRVKRPVMEQFCFRLRTS